MVNLLFYSSEARVALFYQLASEAFIKPLISFLLSKLTTILKKGSLVKHRWVMVRRRRLHGD